MRTKIKRIVFRAIYLLLIASVLYATVINPAAFNKWREANTFQPGLRTLDGSPARYIFDVIDNEETGIVVFVVHFNTGCKYCTSLLTYLQSEVNKFSKAYLIGINIGNSQRSVERYIKKNGFDFPVFIGISRLPEEAGDALPYTMLFFRGTDGQFYLYEDGNFYGTWIKDVIPTEVRNLLKYMREVENKE